MKICIVVGTRPQIIKTYPLIKVLVSRKIDLRIVHTGQHFDYEMSKSFFDELKIQKPDINLGIKNGSGTEQLGQIILKLEKPLKKINPDFVLVPGDTRSALGAALCAFRLGYRIGHMEAGARSNDFALEEEINRRIIDNCSSLLFAPTKNCYMNLKKEGVLGSVYNTGDTMYDVFLEYQKILNLNKPRKRKFVLMTIHRRNNIENRTQISKIIQLVRKISQTGIEVIFPIHPHTKKQIESFGISLNNINTISPVKYSRMLELLSEARLLITDSGGLQKESYWSNTPCVTIRPSTEWIETLDEKHNLLLEKITSTSFKIIEKIISNPPSKLKSSKFGKGNASKKILNVLKNY